MVAGLVIDFLLHRIIARHGNAVWTNDRVQDGFGMSRVHVFSEQLAINFDDGFPLFRSDRHIFRHDNRRGASDGEEQRRVRQATCCFDRWIAHVRHFGCPKKAVRWVGLASCVLSIMAELDRPCSKFRSDGFEQQQVNRVLAMAESAERTQSVLNLLSQACTAPGVR